MRRFFCSFCQKPKRVQRLPPDVVTSMSDRVEDRIGTCRWHSHLPGDSRVRNNSRGRVVAHLGSTRKIKAKGARSKSKKG